MIVRHHDVAIPLDNAWWEEAEMKDFTPSSNRYVVDTSNLQDRRVCTIPVLDVVPPRRAPGIPVFNKSVDEGISAAERVIRILRGFVAGTPIPPVELVRTLNGPHPYKLTAGFHRFYCSIAAGFTHVPAIQGFDGETLDHPEMRNDQDLC